MPITVIPGQQGGNGGFFGAAGQAFTDFSKRAQEAMLVEKELALSKEKLKQDKQIADMRNAQETARLQFDQAQFQARAAGNTATMEAMAPGLMQEFPNINWQAAVGAEPDAFRGLLDQLVNIRGQKAQTDAAAADNTTRNRAIDVELEIARMRDARQASTDAIEQNRLDLGLAQLTQEAEQFQRQHYLNQVETISRIAADNQIPPGEVPALYERFYGSPLGDPEAIRSQDMKAFETEGAEGETFTQFARRKAADRAFGFFQTAPEDRQKIEEFLSTGNPTSAMHQAMQALQNGQFTDAQGRSIAANKELTAAFLRDVRAIVDIVYPTGRVNPAVTGLESSSGRQPQGSPPSFTLGNSPVLF